MRFIMAIIVCSLVCGCMKDAEYDVEYSEHLVVDGSIESGCCAVVALSLNIPFCGSYNRDDFRDMIVRWAKVTVECDGRREVLVGRREKDYPTQYIYTGSEIFGEVGKSYTLIVQYSGRTWQATTTIPEPAELSNITVERVRDSLCVIYATLPPLDTPCAIDCALGDSHYYAPTLLGVYDACDTMRRVQISRPLDNLYRSDYMTIYKATDSVRLKLCTMDRFSYTYRSLWENNVINSFNPIFPAVDNLPTNMSGDAMGIWAGYGRSIVRLGVVGNMMSQ